MGFHPWLVVGLAAFDLMLVVAAYFQLRGYPPMDRRSLSVTGAGLAGFVFHAFLFFDGASWSCNSRPSLASSRFVGSTISAG
jgi:hypothetical protein